MTNMKSALRLSLTLAAALLVPLAAEASSLSIDPTRILLAGQEAKAITLRNRSSYDTLVQARVHQWSQTEDGVDVLEETDRLLVSPPIIRVPAGSEKVVRVALRTPVEDETEAAFRLVLSEVIEENTSIGGPGVRFAIEFNLPVFANRERPLPPDLDWSIRDLADGDWEVEAANVGKSHVQIRSLSLSCLGSDDEERVVGTSAKPGYLLPGAQRSWRIAPQEIECALHQQNESQLAAVDEAPLLVFAPDEAPDKDGSFSATLNVLGGAGEDQQVAAIDLSVLNVLARTDRGELKDRIAVRISAPQQVVADVDSR